MTSTGSGFGVRCASASSSSATELLGVGRVGLRLRCGIGLLVGGDRLIGLVVVGPDHRGAGVAAGDRSEEAGRVAEGHRAGKEQHGEARRPAERQAGGDARWCRLLFVEGEIAELVGSGQLVGGGQLRDSWFASP